MADILEQIAEHNQKIYLEKKLEVSLSKVMDMAYAASGTDFAFEKTLGTEEMSFICECKKASPSKGVIAEDFPYLDIARDYEKAEASCISVLTEPKWFMGSLDYLDAIASEVRIPVLRKDFTVDEYMIYEARAHKASAVLLICSILDAKTLGKYIRLCDELELTALVEAHDKNECDMALGEGARVIGVNNRNLRDFTVDPANCLRLREYVGDKALFVAESGVKSREDIEVLEKEKVDAVLIGESMMRAEDKTVFLKALKGIE
ncbi:MAG: indole-3-glycerol phosphate synthase TrpC [Clostridiales bacterium]|nr:indole-3-glycerol phosphate synthase TrpC [Clostridiales bacterium]